MGAESQVRRRSAAHGLGRRRRMCPTAHRLACTCTPQRFCRRSMQMQSVLEASGWACIRSGETRALLRRSAGFGAPREGARALARAAPRLPRRPWHAGVRRRCVAAVLRRSSGAALPSCRNHPPPSCAYQMQCWCAGCCVLEGPARRRGRRAPSALAPFPPVRRAPRRAAMRTRRHDGGLLRAGAARRTAARRAAPLLLNCPITIAPCARTPAPAPRASRSLQPGGIPLAWAVDVRHRSSDKRRSHKVDSALCCAALVPADGTAVLSNGGCALGPRHLPPACCDATPPLPQMNPRPAAPSGFEECYEAVQSRVRPQSRGGWPHPAIAAVHCRAVQCAGCASRFVLAKSSAEESSASTQHDCARSRLPEHCRPRSTCPCVAA